MLTVSIVTYHTADDELRECFASINSPLVDDIIVIDNSRTPSTREICESTPKVTYIPSDNIGYGRAHNIALRQSIARGQRYHLVLNSDVRFDPEILSRIASYMDANPAIGTLQPAIFYPDGRPQFTCRLLPSPTDLLARRFLPEKWVEKINYRYLLQASDRVHTLNLPQHQGSFMFMRVDALKDVGIFDERFFLYGEDVDLTRRLHEKYLTIFWPEVSATHKHREESYYKFRPLMSHIVNLFRYFNKWGWIFDSGRKRFNRRAVKALEAEMSGRDSAITRGQDK
ncbi:MAG: glycosyltransferase family 2 protein [Barnesiella sp.]|nr:glycosyltransferase family 2 protein [Barnesiella sp.]